MTALSFFSLDKISIIFLVGKIARSKIYLINNIQPKIDWIGERNVYTSVSWSNILKMIGNILPAGKIWFDRLDFIFESY